jgi:hypothetical protein
MAQLPPDADPSQIQKLIMIEAFKRLQGGPSLTAPGAASAMTQQGLPQFAPAEAYAGQAGGGDGMQGMDPGMLAYVQAHLGEDLPGQGEDPSSFGPGPGAQPEGAHLGGEGDYGGDEFAHQGWGTAPEMDYGTPQPPAVGQPTPEGGGGPPRPPDRNDGRDEMRAKAMQELGKWMQQMAKLRQEHLKSKKLHDDLLHAVRGSGLSLTDLRSQIPGGRY